MHNRICVNRLHLMFPLVAVPCLSPVGDEMWTAIDTKGKCPAVPQLCLSLNGRKEQPSVDVTWHMREWYNYIPSWVCR